MHNRGKTWQALQATKEKTIKAKEAALATREDNQNERDKQLTLLKAHVTQLELRSSDLVD